MSLKKKRNKTNLFHVDEKQLYCNVFKYFKDGVVSRKSTCQKALFTVNRTGLLFSTKR